MEQKIQYKQIELEQFEKLTADYDGLQAKFDSELKRLEAEQQELLSESNKSLRLEVVEQRKLTETLGDSITKKTLEREAINKEIADLDIYIIDKRLEAEHAEKRLETALSKLEMAKKTLQSTAQSEADLQETIRELIGSKEAVVAESDQLKKTRHKLTTDYVAEIAEYDRIIADKKHSLEILDTKLLLHATDLEQYAKEEEFKRKELATWQKKLEEQDKNMRLREQKVNQSEQKLLNNANLLNL